MSGKRIEELENYNITKAAEGDYIPIVATGDENKTGKCPVSDFRDQMAKINVINIVTMIISLIRSLMEGKNGETFHVTTAFEKIAAYIKTNWFDFSTGRMNQTSLQTLKTTSASAMRQVSDEGFALVKMIWDFGSEKERHWYLGRITKQTYDYTAAEGSTQPDTIYVVHYEEDGKKYWKEYASQEAAAQSSKAQTPGATIEAADWAGGADKQPYVFDWTKDRVADMLEAMEPGEFGEGLIYPITGQTEKIYKEFNRLYNDINNQSQRILSLESKVATLENALQQYQNSGNNGGEIYDNSEDVALRNRADALWAQFVDSDASSMTTEEMVAALENGANITPDPNATLAERIEALEALAAQQAQE